MSPSANNLIKFLAQVAVDQYIAEIRQQGTLSPQETERQLVDVLPGGQSDTQSCPDHINPAMFTPDNMATTLQVEKHNVK
jgi:hypothetical protein